MVKLYIMCGLAFSGKSTLARKIAEHTGSRLIAFDTLWVKKDREQPVSKDAEGWRCIRKIAQDEIREALTKGVSVVYDDSNIRFEHREELRAIARDLNSKSIVVYLDTPLELMRQRESMNKKTGERHEVNSKNFQTVLEQLQVPSLQEKVVVFKPEMEIENWLTDVGRTPK